jgi:8-amino-7-oxononanoate synthase
MDFDAAVALELSRLREQHLLRTPRVLAGAHGPEVILDGRRVLDFCSNDYLGLAGDPRLASAARAALDSHGLGAASSRHVSGTTDLHRAAEARLAAFVAAPSALLYSNGYAANTGALPALLGPDAVVFSDQLNHASLIDGIRLSRAHAHVYRHLDLDHLRRLVREHRGSHAHALVVTESVFSMEGDCAPLPALRELCDRERLGLYVDEAHSLGIMGPRGRGACADAGIRPDVLIGTLGKAFGCAGAFAAGQAETIRLLENRSRTHVFSTAAPPLLAAATLTAVDLVEAADDRRAQLLDHVARLRRGLASLGRPAPQPSAAIVPVHVGAAATVVAVSAALLDAGFFVHGIRPPTVPEGGCRLRLVPIATHRGDQVDALVAALSRALANHL